MSPIWIGGALASVAIAIFPRLLPLPRTARRQTLFGEPATSDANNIVRLIAIAALGIFVALLYFDI